MPTTSDAAPGSGLIALAMAYGPRVLSTLAILLIGVLAAWTAKRLVRWIVERSGLDALLERVGIAKLLYRLGIKDSVPHALGQLAWYTGLLLTASVISESLGLPGLAEGIGVITAYLPRALAAALILLAGFFVADLAQKTIGRITAARDDINAPHFLGKVAYYAVLVLAGTMAADHLGFETRLINAIIETAIQASLFGVALAFALGAKGTFSHVVARFYAERLYRPGDRVRVRGMSGTVIRFGAAQVLIETDSGEEVIIPAQTIMDEVVSIERIEAQRRPSQGEAGGEDPTPDAGADPERP